MYNWGPQRRRRAKKILPEMMSIMIFYVDNIIECTTKLIEIMSEFSKLIGYKISVQN